MADYLDRTLPRRYSATVQLHLGRQVEADVAEWEKMEERRTGNGNGAVAVQTWTIPAATMTMPLEFPDDFEVQVHDQQDEVRLVAVIELVSPSNKDREETRREFAAKCAAYLQRGIGVVVVDLVTTRHFNLHNELVHLLNAGDALEMPDEAYLYAVAYRPVQRDNRSLADIWPIPLALGEPLPLLPLALLGAAPIPLDLEATYMDTRQRSRL
jgi:hypothetical protein